MTHAIIFSSEGVWTKCCVVFRLLLMAIFAFGVNGEYPCVLSIRIYPTFLIANEASYCPGSTWHNREIHRWTNKKTSNLALANDSWFNFYFVFSFIEKQYR